MTKRTKKDVEQSASYYDSVYANTKTYCLQTSWEQSQYYAVYKYVLSLLPIPSTVVELGCGTGQLAEALVSKGDTYIEGIDFSGEAINIAKQRTPQNFIKGDLYDYTPPAAQYYIATEVFEHIESDLFVISKLPKSSILIFSVPNFYCKGHVRRFLNPEEIQTYYKDTLTITSITQINNIFVVMGIK